MIYDNDMIKYSIKFDDKCSITYDDEYERIFALWAGSFSSPLE